MAQGGALTGEFIDSNPTTGRYDRYVPRLASEWDDHHPGSLWRSVDGSLVFVDISGFTNLSEKLARRGRIGAEELTSVLDRVFGRMLDEAYARGGSLLKFGGDALLLVFESPDHVMQACAAAVEMRRALRDASSEPTSVGRIHLRMSVGVHTGPIDFFLVGGSHRELIVTGPVASGTVAMEGTASAGEIVVSEAVRRAIPTDFVGDDKGDGWLFRKRVVRLEPHGVVERRPISDEIMSLFVPIGLRDHLASQFLDSEHRVATVGFVKFKGVDGLLASLPRERVAEALDGFVRAVQEAADDEGVTFLSSDVDADGGKVILTTGIPTSSHDDEGRMLRAADRILAHDFELDVRIGLNRGHVFAGEIGTGIRKTFTVMGDTVNLAARLMAAAPSGGLLASPGVLNRSSTLFRTEALEPFYVKGKEQPVRSFAVFEETGVRPPETQHELPFTGRELELRQVMDAIEGDGGVLSIMGDTGVGKSRLISEAIAGLPDRWALTIQAEPNSTDNPYWAFRDPMRKLLGIERRAQDLMATDLESKVAERLPELLPLLPLIGDVLHIDIAETPETGSIEPRYRPERAADAVASLLEAIAEGDLLIIGEDAHWMDDASLGLLRRIASSGRDRGWSIVLTARPDEGFEPLGEAIKLDRLDDDDARSVAVAATAAFKLHPDDLRTIVARADGNPLFLSEILRLVRDSGGVDGLPESLDGVVTAEIDTLPTLTRQLLRYSSVLGRSFRRVVLEEFLEPEELELDEATRHDLARYIAQDGPTRLRFRHAVVQSVAYEGLSYRKRRELHARAGDVIERLAGGDTEAVSEFLAFHYGAAGTSDKAWRYSVVAGRKAQTAYANAEAAEHFRRAIEMSRRVDVSDEEMSDVWARLGEVLEGSSRYEQAIDAFRHAIRHTDDAVRRADLELRSARSRLRLGSYPSALADVTRGERVLKEADGHREAAAAAARLMSFRSVVRRSQEKPAEALRHAQNAVAAAQEIGEREALARAYGVIDWSYWMLGQPERANHSDAALEIYLELGQLDLAANILNNKGGFAYFENRWSDAIDLYEQACDAYDRAGNAAGAALAQANIAEILINRGQVSEAEGLLTAALRVIESVELAEDLIFARTLWARMLGSMGRTEEALESLNVLRQLVEETGQAMTLIEVDCLRVLALAQLGRTDEAFATLDSMEASAGEALGYFAATHARARAATLLAIGEAASALAEIEGGLQAVAEQGLSFDRLLLLEMKRETEGRIGLQPDPTLRSEVASIRRELGMRAPLDHSLSRT